jgi:hypothetical protein
VTSGFSAGGNTASGESQVGAQAQVVFGDITVYQVPSGASATEKFRVGVNCLKANFFTEARKLIGEAITQTQETWEMRYYWLLAMLSGRALYQLSREERGQLRAAENRHLLSSGDEWVRCVQVVFRLLAALQDVQESSGTDADPDVEAVVKEFDELGPARCEEILRHLDALLKGPLADAMWRRELQIAKGRRLSEGREDRAWMFFQPIPAKPVEVQVSPRAAAIADRLAVGVGLVVFALAFGDVGLRLVGHVNGWGLIGYLLAAIGCYAITVNGAECRFRSQRRRSQELNPLGALAGRPLTKFATGVDSAFSYYFARYVPSGTDREVWLQATRDIREELRDEVVGTYTGHVANADRLRWLIRHLVSETRKSWEAGTLRDDSEQPRASAAVFWYRVGLTSVVMGGVWILVAAPGELETVIVAALTGSWAARGWVRISAERKRFAADKEKARRRKENSDAAYASWRDRLARRPEDAEMAAWLDYDLKLLMDHAMRSCRLARSGVVAHAFIERPSDGPKRARVRNGPWRYTRYKILLFLLTSHGVRQVTADLDFMKLTFQIRDEIDYRFDTIVSVRVTKMDEDERLDSDGKQRFVLTLISGRPLSFVVTNPHNDELQPGEDADTVSAATLDAAGVTNAFEVLQGIGADGKEWLTARNERAMVLP